MSEGCDPSPLSGVAVPAERPWASLGHSGVRSGGWKESQSGGSPPLVTTKRSPQNCSGSSSFDRKFQG